MLISASGSYKVKELAAALPAHPTAYLSQISICYLDGLKIKNLPHKPSRSTKGKRLLKHRLFKPHICPFLSAILAADNYRSLCFTCAGFLERRLNLTLKLLGPGQLRLLNISQKQKLNSEVYLCMV